MRSSLLSLLCLIASVAFFSSPITTVDAQICTAAPPLPEVVKIAILVFCNGPVGILSANPNFASECAYDTTASGGSTRTFQYGVHMYVDGMIKQQPMPLSNGGNVSFSYTYINIAYVNWLATDWPTFNARMGNETSGFLWDLAATTKYGGPYTFFVPPFSMTQSLTTLVNICEDNDLCMVLTGFSSSASMFVCTKTDGVLPADCTRRSKLAGTRRFNNFLGVLFDSTTVAMSALDTYHTLGAKSISIIAENPIYAPFAGDAVLRTQEFAKQLNLKVLSTSILEICSTAAGNCPKYQADGVTAATGQTQILPNGLTATQFGQQIKELNPDAIVVISSSVGQSAHAFGSLFDGFRAVDWTPKMVDWAGGGDASMKPYLKNYNDMLYTWTTAPWDSRLTGPSYRNLKTESNFELYPAEDELDAPAVFAREFNKRFDQYYTGGKFDFSAAGSVMTVLGFQALNFAQKLIETALSASIQALVTASLKVSTPSVYHQLQFDTTGRTMRVNEMLLQYIPSTSSAHGIQLIAPYNIGVTAIYPVPTWAERVFDPKFYDLPLEKMMAAITAVIMAICIGFGALLLVNYKHAVIRAATPSFCLITILGALMMLTANFFHTTVASDSHCAAQVWLITIGFTLLFSALFIKTYRIYKIFFASKKLQVVKMKDRDLMMAVAVFVIIDIIINAVWQGGYGMNSRTMVVDSLRPSTNYIECDYNDTLGFVYTHIALKCGLLLFGICLTWLVRNAPSQFSEASFMGICIYNVSFIICFVIPLLSAQVGGRETVYLIRAFAIMFVTLSTTCILYIPKFLTIYSNGRTKVFNGKEDGGATHLGDEDDDMEMGSLPNKSNGSKSNGQLNKSKSLGQSTGGPATRTTTAFSTGQPKDIDSPQNGEGGKTPILVNAKSLGGVDENTTQITPVNGTSGGKYVVPGSIVENESIGDATAE